MRSCERSLWYNISYLMKPFFLNLTNNNQIIVWMLDCLPTMRDLMHLMFVYKFQLFPSIFYLILYAFSI